LSNVQIVPSWKLHQKPLIILNFLGGSMKSAIVVDIARIGTDLRSIIISVYCYKSISFSNVEYLFNIDSEYA